MARTSGSPTKRSTTERSRRASPRTIPALDLRPAKGHGFGPLDADLVVAALDDFAPTAIQESSDSIRVFFRAAGERELASTGMRKSRIGGKLHLSPVDVEDEDWARRSQRGLRPVRIGRIVIVPTVASADLPRAAGGQPHARHSPGREKSRAGHARSEAPRRNGRARMTLVIEPSTGFGTGHHATTQLCLEALQTLKLQGRSVLDVGTGSGILALAAARLGAKQVLGIDNDPDAMRAARKNRRLNKHPRVRFTLGDLLSTTLPAADVVTANLTGAQLARASDRLAGAVRPGGTLIVSGVLTEEVGPVRDSFRSLRFAWRRKKGEWAAIGFNRSPRSKV
jgi:ribosomal protein L11 methyltransferase